MILKWIPRALLAIAFTLLAILLSPILALLVKSDGYFPDWLSWFQTPDNPAIGDALFQQQQMAWTKSRYLFALFWLWRNPAYGFDHAIGARIPEKFVCETWGDDKTTNAPLHAGLVFRRVGDYWQLHAIIPRTSSTCWKINLGWKLWGRLEAGQVRQLVCTITPFAKVTP